MKTCLKLLRTAAIAALTAAFILSVMLTAACGARGNTDPTAAPGETAAPDGDQPTAEPVKTALTVEQTAQVIAAAEAFFESGLSYGENSPLTFKQMESFIYYLYNGELSASEGSFAVIPRAEAEQRIKTLFGAERLMNTGKRAGTVQKYYCDSDNYYVRTAEPAGQVRLGDAYTAEDGSLIVYAAVRGGDGSGASFKLTFEVKDEGLLVKSCERYDEI
ncbi:MAG: hypothetical protein J5544_06110 [Clostridia bacterium]|nr:hypothetical protein [Clostridia bacterium]